MGWKELAANFTALYLAEFIKKWEQYSFKNKVLEQARRKGGVEG